MQAVFEVPNNSIAKLQAVIFENSVENYVEWKYLTILNVIAHLPANRALIVQKPHAL
jgi:hypothetical protein